MQPKEVDVVHKEAEFKELVQSGGGNYRRDWS